LDEIATRVELTLADAPEASLAWEPVPLDLYDGGLPPGIASSWVFVLRAAATSGAERHPNSHQRVMSWRGSADLQTWEDGRWRSNILRAESVALEDRWLSIPVNAWHKPVMGAENCVVVSFHTVPASQLIEERGDPPTGAELRRQTYAAMSDPSTRGVR
jgi:hypothetical protein